MACAPIFLMAYLAICGRTLVVPGPIPEYGPESHRAILAYVQVLRHNRAIKLNPRAASDGELAEMVEVWIHPAQPLPDLRIAGVFDFGDDAAKAQIERQRRVLMEALNRRVHQAVDSGRPDEGTPWVERLLALASVGKYSSLASVRSSALVQHGIARYYRQIQGELSPSARQRWESALAATRLSQQDMEHMLAQMRAYSLSSEHRLRIAPQDFGIGGNPQLAQASADPEVRRLVEGDATMVDAIVRMEIVAHNSVSYWREAARHRTLMARNP
mgnify:CR=1 FL=1